MRSQSLSPRTVSSTTRKKTWPNRWKGLINISSLFDKWISPSQQAQRNKVKHLCQPFSNVFSTGISCQGNLILIILYLVYWFWAVPLTYFPSFLIVFLMIITTATPSSPPSATHPQNNNNNIHINIKSKWIKTATLALLFHSR